FYYLLGEDLPAEDHYSNMQALRKWGFKVSEATKCCNSLQEVFDFLNYWDKERKNLPVATDGVVLKVNSLRQQKNLGYTAKSPRWAIAYKFKAERALTRLNTVTYQVGRTGAITPVANLDPVQLSGTVVRRASLHNADIIQKLDLYLGDMVYVEKGGEIIPKIVGVDTDSRLLVGDKVQFITRCPECGTPLVRFEGEAAHYCPNDSKCPPQIKGRMEHFISRKAMNIDGIGSETVDLFFRKGVLHDISTFYDLKGEDILMDGIREKSVHNILKSIRESVNVPFERVLYALGIRFVGETTAKKLAFAFQSIDALEQATLEQLTAVDEIGGRIAESVQLYFRDESNRQIVEKLKLAGLQMTLSQERMAAKSDKLKGLSIVISGTFTLHSRDEYKDMIDKHSGKNLSGVSAKIDYILAGDNMGPAKLEKAAKMGIKIINENEFLRLIK
ncbi:MAG TPA: NAD-dependent DNA ligase LigA, partial [Bacteroidales bacterium]